MKTIEPSELVINSDGSIFHLHIKPEQLADYVLLVGDPDRVDLLRTLLSPIEHEGRNREFVWVTGYFKTQKITLLSTGIGTDNIDIVMHELDALVNIDFKKRTVKDKHTSLNILRLGTSGAIQPGILPGTLVFSQYSAGIDGLLNWYAGRDTVSDTDLKRLLCNIWTGPLFWLLLILSGTLNFGKKGFPMPSKELPSLHPVFTDRKAVWYVYLWPIPTTCLNWCHSVIKGCRSRILKWKVLPLPVYHTCWAIREQPSV